MKNSWYLDRFNEVVQKFNSCLFFVTLHIPVCMFFLCQDMIDLFSGYCAVLSLFAEFNVNLINSVLFITVVHIVWRGGISRKVQRVLWSHSVLHASRVRCSNCIAEQNSDSDSVYWTCSQKAKNHKAKQTIMHCTTKQYNTSLYDCRDKLRLLTFSYDWNIILFDMCQL